MYEPKLAAPVAAALLGLAWMALAAALVAADPPVDAVAWLPVVACLLAALVAGLAVTVPAPESRATHTRVAVVGWLAALPLTLGLMTLAETGPSDGGQPLAWPAAHVWAWLAAALTTWLAAALALRRRRLRLGIASLLAMAGCAAVVGWPVLAAPGVPVGGCSVPSVAGSGRVEIAAQALVDGRQIGSAELSGERSGADERWTGRLRGAGGDFAVEFAQFSGSAVLRYSPSGGWQPVDVPPHGASPGAASLPADSATLDNRVVATILRVHGPAVEDLGIESGEAGPVRGCRVLIDGNTALETFLPAAWLVSGSPLDVPRTLGVWRGELEWWSGPEGVLTRAGVRVGGHPADAWGLRGLRGELRAEISISEPAPTRDLQQPRP